MKRSSSHKLSISALYRHGPLFAAFGVAMMAGLTSAGEAAAKSDRKPANPAPYAITEVRLPTSDKCMAVGGLGACVAPAGLAFGKDGKLWFALQLGSDGKGGIGRIAPDGSGYVEFSKGLAPGSSILHLASGSDGNIWFTDWGGRSIGRITPDGVISQFRSLVPGRTLLPPSSPMAKNGEAEAVVMPYEIVADRNGDLWFTAQDIYAGVKPNFLTGYVGRFSPSDPQGTLRTYALTGIPSGITSGPDGEIWVIHFNRWTDKKGGGITRISKTGELTTFPLPSPADQSEALRETGCAMTTAELTVGPDGAIWFTQEMCPYIGRLSPKDGRFSFFSEGLTGATHLVMIRAARDGSLYVGDDGSPPYRIWRVTMDGRINPITGSARRDGIWSIIDGPDGDLWFAHRFSDVIGRMNIP